MDTFSGDAQLQRPIGIVHEYYNPLVIYLYSCENKVSGWMP